MFCKQPDSSRFRQEKNLLPALHIKLMQVKTRQLVLALIGKYVGNKISV